MDNENISALDRTAIRAIFHRNEGAITQLAADLKITTQAVSGWLRGTPSKRIAAAAHTKATALLAMEANSSASVSQDPVSVNSGTHRT